MNYEQRYKQAIEKIRKGLQPLSDGAKTSGVTKAFLEEVFPELAESKDEKVRKALITFFQRFPYDSIEQAGTNAKEAIAWLEKQGQEPKKVSIWKHWKNGIAGNGDGKPIYLIKNGFTYSLSSCLSFECDYIELSELDNLLLEKQGEQKNKINSYKITFEDVLVLECAMKTIKITEGGNELYEKLAPLYNKIHNVYLLEKQGEQRKQLINKACDVLVNCIEDFMTRRMEIWDEECKKQTLENIRKTLEK